MPRDLRARLNAAKDSAVRLWDRVPIRVQGTITAVLPLIAVLISALLAFTGNLQRVDIETDIQRKFETSVSLGELTTLMVNAETGVRGYQLTGQTGFLEPFEEASTALPGTLTRLTELASAEPGEKPRADKLQRIERLRTLTGTQMADLARQRDLVAPGGGGETQADLRRDLTYGKDLMDQIRAAVFDMQSEERQLLDDRISDINAIRVRDYVSVAVALTAAVLMRFLAWYLFRTGILRRVERLTENVRSLRNGLPGPEPLPEKRDKMGELEREVRLLDRSSRS